MHSHHRGVDLFRRPLIAAPQSVDWARRDESGFGLGAAGCRLTLMRARIALVWLALTQMGCGPRIVPASDVAPPRSTAPRAVASRPLLMTEPISESLPAPPAPAPIGATPPACETLPRPPRGSAAGPLLIALPKPGAPFTVWAEQIETAWVDFGGPNASRGQPPAFGRLPSCESAEAEVRAALAEADLRACRVADEPPCGRLRVSIDSAGRIWATEIATHHAMSKSGQCVTEFLMERQVRSASLLCATALTFDWTYFVDR